MSIKHQVEVVAEVETETEDNINRGASGLLNYFRGEKWITMY